MARLTQAQIRHLQKKVAEKVAEKQREGVDPAQLQKLVLKQRELQNRGVLITIKALPASEVKKLVLKSYGGRYPANIGDYVRAHALYKQKVTEPLEEIIRGIKALTDGANGAIAELRKEGEKLIDQAVFAGSSEEILEAIEAFMAK